MELKKEVLKPITEQIWPVETPVTVSIVVTTYNHEKYIHDAIQGFLMQKTSFKVEILINDDASTDNTAEIVRSYEQKYPWLFVTFYQAENQYSQGIKPWFHILFPAARGKYIALCEGDDYWTDPLKLQKQVDFLEENKGYVAVIHNAKVYDMSKKNFYLFHEGFGSNRMITTSEMILGGGGIFPTASLLFINDKIIFDDNLETNFAGDMVIALKLTLIGSFYYLEDIMSVYRIHAGGVSSSITIGKNVAKMEEVYLSNIDLLKRYNCLTKNKFEGIIKETIKVNYIKILRLRKIKIMRDFKYLKNIRIRDAIYLYRKSLFSHFVG